MEEEVTIKETVTLPDQKVVLLDGVKLPENANKQESISNQIVLLQKKYQIAKDDFIKQAEDKIQRLLKKLHEEYIKNSLAVTLNMFEQVQLEHSWVAKYKRLEELFWNRDAILNTVKENYLRITKVEMMWYPWKRVIILLPRVWSFEGYVFTYFISDDFVSKYDFKKKPVLRENLFSKNDISELLEAINNFMAALGCETDWDNIEYKNKIMYDYWGEVRCHAWTCLKNITWLDSWYPLSDPWLYWTCLEKKNDMNLCCFFVGQPRDSRLFLK